MLTQGAEELTPTGISPRPSTSSTVTTTWAAVEEDVQIGAVEQVPKEEWKHDLVLAVPDREQALDRCDLEPATQAQKDHQGAAKLGQHAGRRGHPQNSGAHPNDG